MPPEDEEERADSGADPILTLMVQRLPASVGQEQIDGYRDDMIQPARIFWIGNPLFTNLDAMRGFAALADLVHSELEVRPNWDAVRGFARCVEPYLLEIRQEVRHLITTNEARLGLGENSEPFRVDLGMHRWLRNEYEPAYSDWL